MDGTLRCLHCGDVIGVYEPMIVLFGGQARTTSRAAEREAVAPGRECYHEACYTQADGADPVLE
jgi:hypothetical protein